MIPEPTAAAAPLRAMAARRPSCFCHAPASSMGCLPPRSLVVVNPTARGGKAAALWSRVVRQVACRSRPEVMFTDAAGGWTGRIGSAAAAGVRVFIAAGGDGTVSALVNALIDARELIADSDPQPFVLGAVGLGSSNDFHKPFGWVESSVPLRIDPTAWRLQDVGLARYVDGSGAERQRHFVVSASLGFCAEANARFNDDDAVLRALKPRSTTAAIAYAALQAMLRFPRVPATLHLGRPSDEPRELFLSSLSISKTPFLSGWLRYDTPVEPDDGHFAVNLCDDLSRGQLLAVLADLTRGRFVASGRSGTHHWRSHRVTVSAQSPMALELDGEVVRATRVTFSILRQKLRCCV